MRTIDTTMGFQSTLPLRGVTKNVGLMVKARGLFQSTLPLRGVTAGVEACLGAWDISIHTPLAGSDFSGWLRRGRRSYFNPHSPCGE